MIYSKNQFFFEDLIVEYTLIEIHMQSFLIFIVHTCLGFGKFSRTLNLYLVIRK